MYMLESHLKEKKHKLTTDTMRVRTNQAQLSSEYHEMVKNSWVHAGPGSGGGQGVAPKAH